MLILFLLLTLVFSQTYWEAGNCPAMAYPYAPSNPLLCCNRVTCHNNVVTPAEDCRVPSKTVYTTQNINSLVSSITKLCKETKNVVVASDVAKAVAQLTITSAASFAVDRNVLACDVADFIGHSAFLTDCYSEFGQAEGCAPLETTDTCNPHQDFVTNPFCKVGPLKIGGYCNYAAFAINDNYKSPEALRDCLQVATTSNCQVEPFRFNMYWWFDRNMSIFSCNAPSQLGSFIREMMVFDDTTECPANSVENTLRYKMVMKARELIV